MGLGAVASPEVQGEPPAATPGPDAVLSHTTSAGAPEVHAVPAHGDAGYGARLAEKTTG